jgi:hypothetical protein
MPELYTFYLLLQGLQLLWLIGVTAAIWLRKPGMDASAAATKLQHEFDLQLKLHRDETRLEFNRQSLQIKSIETHMQHMPNSEELAEIKGTVDTINARQALMAETLKVLRDSQSRVEDYLLKRKG